MYKEFYSDVLLNYHENWRSTIHGKDGVIGSIPIEGSSKKVSQMLCYEVFERFLYVSDINTSFLSQLPER